MVEGEEADDETADAMEALDRQIRAPTGFVAASTGPVGVKASDADPTPVVANSDEIDITLDD